MNIRSFILFTLILITTVFQPLFIYAQEIILDEVIVAKTVVRDVLLNESRQIPGTDTRGPYQKIKVEIIDGPEKGKVLTIENDYEFFKVGDVFYLTHTKNELDGTNMYAVGEPYRIPQISVLLVLFVITVILFGGKQSLRGLLSLVGSFFFIFVFLLPGILNGYSPILVSICVSSLVIVLGSYITHGFNKTTSSAVIGMILTVTLTGILAYVSIGYTKLSGFGSEEATYLNFNSGGRIDLAGLLLGGILIGLLGVLYDAAIGQAVSVEELHRAGPHLSKRFIYLRTIRIGREHIGALVNTLAIAYVGAALPLLLLFFQTVTGSIIPVINREIFATEIVRTLIGSIGLVLAVPVTTFISVAMLVRPKPSGSEIDIEQEKHTIEHMGHSH